MQSVAVTKSRATRSHQIKSWQLTELLAQLANVSHRKQETTQVPLQCFVTLFNQNSLSSHIFCQFSFIGFVLCRWFVDRRSQSLLTRGPDAAQRC